MQLQEIIPPQEVSRIVCNYRYVIEWFSNYKCNDFEKNGTNTLFSLSEFKTVVPEDALSTN